MCPGDGEYNAQSSQLIRILMCPRCFYINLPVCGLTALAIFLVPFSVQEHQKKLDRSLKALFSGLDIVGFTMFVPASVMLFLALQWGGVIYPWSSATVIGLLCGSAVTAILFAFWEHHHGDNSMFPPKLLGRRVITGACMSGFFQGGCMILLNYYLPLWFQVVKKVSPTGSALRTLPTFGSQIIFTVIGTVIIQRTQYLAPPTIVGNAVGAVGCGLLTTMTVSTPVGEWVGFQIIIGAGRGIAMQSPFLAVQAICEQRQMAVGTAVIAWAQLFGGALFVGLGQTVFANLLRSALSEHAPTVDSELVVDAGATNYDENVPLDQQASVLSAYNQAITLTFYLAVAASIGGALTACAMGKVKALQKPMKKDSEEAGSAEKEQSEAKS
jgi:hypothetical protein